ncbi:hypothetical protein PFLA_a2453 [Pseudoalteromonas flavipulchra NCIMB 2033 = ATCC BAA-314]|nr:hypothetical protein [Pseudoalteromonas flavipulchra NCIMB 2033 = ATCC BAA-314]
MQVNIFCAFIFMMLKLLKLLDKCILDRVLQLTHDEFLG